MRRSVWTFLVAVVLAAQAHGGDLAPNDPYYSTYQWYAATLGLPTAWTYSQGSSNIVVAVVDTGVVSGTPDLSGRILAPLSATGSAPFSDETLSSSTTLLHGTRVAGVIGMGVNNAIGGAGVGNFGILPITATDSWGYNLSNWIAEAICMAADAGAKAINVSLGTLKYTDIDAAAGYALSKGALTFVAAGNNDSRSGMTGYDNLVFVSGTGRSDERWSNGSGVGSTWGPFVDLSAPADDILTPNGLTTYALADGTSYATALASGTAALVWSINPALTPQQVRGILFSTAVDLGDAGWDEVFGHGRLDIGGAAAAAYSTLPEPSSFLLLAAGAVLLGRRRGASSR